MVSLINREVFEVWPAGTPGALGTAETDIPTLEIFLPPSNVEPSGASMIVCPGGGYVVLADHEGVPVAQWLANYGITVFLLRYRLGPRYQYPTQLQDAQQAIRLVRAHSSEWNLDPQRIGILGFSAGGHLVSTTAIRFSEGNKDALDPVERVSSRPDLQILIYPVISMSVSAGPVTNVWGNNPSPSSELMELLSSEKHVLKSSPPAFLVHSTEDEGVPVANSDLYAASLKSAGVPYEYVRGALGEHGFGLQDSWTHQCISWLQKQGFVKANTLSAL